MPPKKQKSKDIRTFFKKSGDPGRSCSSSSPGEQPGGAAGCEPGGADFQTGAYNGVKGKKENNGESEDRHSHQSHLNKYLIDCNRPCTVLQPLKLSEKNNRIIKCSNQQIIFNCHFKPGDYDRSHNNDSNNVIYHTRFGKVKKSKVKYKRWNELIEKRFTADSYQKILNQRKESEFGKIQQSFSEVHKLKRMFKLGESVCKVVVKDVCVGTGFVLFDNYILTNAHLFQGCITEGRLQPDIDVFVLFNYEEPEPDTNYYYFKLADSYICYGEDDLDYAVLELNPEGQKPNQTTQTKIMKVPPGLLKNFGPLPQNGEACIIGHPAGGVKRVDPICIIEKERREQAVLDHISKYKDCDFIVHKIINSIKNQGIDNIMVGGHRADNVTTYNTFMYHGSSGSPVLDAQGRVFGLHTRGYTYELNNKEESVIEYAQPLLTILKHFVSKMEERGVVDLLKKEAKSNKYLKQVLELPTADTEELSDSTELMHFCEFSLFEDKKRIF